MERYSFALFGGKPAFESPKPTSGLYQPNKERFLGYMQSMYAAKQVTNNGSLVRQLEERLAQLHGTSACIAFCSGFMALQLAIYALALPNRTKVIIPSATYRRMASIIRWAGLEPVFVDINPNTLGVNASLYAERISNDTALLLGVHPIVNMSAVEELELLSAKTGIPLLFDSVEAAYGTIHGRKIGCFAKAEVFSMHASKFINGFEGGYVTTNCSVLTQRLQVMRGFGFVKKEQIIELGCNAKLNEMHAGMSLACLDELDLQIEHNKNIFEVYKHGLAGIPFRLFEYDKDEVRTWKNILVQMQHGWHLTRDELLAILQAENILARPYYTPPLHIAEKVTKPLLLENTENICATTCVLPSGHHVSCADAKRICQIIQKIYKNQDKLTKGLRGGMGNEE